MKMIVALESWSLHGKGVLKTKGEFPSIYSKLIGLIH